MDFKDELFSKIETLDTRTREKFVRIYKVIESSGKLLLPSKMEPWVKESFGDINKVELQHFIKIINKVTGEGSIFNPLRSKRPLIKDPSFKGLGDEVEFCQGDHFSTYQNSTPEDVFGRIKGKYCVTASNVAKYDSFHSLIIFNEHNPLNFSAEKIEDMLDVAKKYFKKANEINPESLYPLLFWNILWRAGASVVHGHAQVLLTQGMAYSKIDFLRKQILEYENAYFSKYFDDSYAVHKSLGLGFEYAHSKIMVKLTPIKNNEVLIISNDSNNNFAKAINHVLTSLRDKISSKSFNLMVYFPPLSKTQEPWPYIPYFARIVDRGNLESKTSDIGGMELYAQSVVESNPYTVMQALKI